MGVLYQQDRSFAERVSDNLERDFVRQATRTAQDRFNARRHTVTAEMPEWEALRDQAADIREHVLTHLDYYLNRFIEAADAAGSVVHFAHNAKEATDTILEIAKARGVRRVVKTKSMVSEEIGTNRALLDAGLEVDETDLGEWILQLDDWDHPSHIIGPAIHKDKHSVYELFVAHGYEGAEEAAEMTRFARAKLRERFLQADMGITGCNYAIAETGSVAIITNEGNGRMVTTLPDTQVVLMGMERLLPTLADLDALMQVFVRSAVGTKVSSYLSMTNGPRRADELDGPEALHIIIIDNGRSEMLAGPFRSMLRCIRCGTCQNVCPVYRHITGHSYGSIYEGPMGIVLTPLLEGYAKTADLPYASTLCGECTDHCPVKIPLHELILLHRQQIVSAGLTSAVENRVFKLAGLGLAGGRRFHAATALGAPAMRLLAKGGTRRDRLTADARLPVLRNWTKHRDLPLLSRAPFHAWAKKRERGDERG